MIFAADRMATATSVFSESALKWFTFSKVGYYRGKIKDALVNNLACLWVGQRRQTQPLPGCASNLPNDCHTSGSPMISQI